VDGTPRERAADGAVVAGQISQSVKHLPLPDDRVHQVGISFENHYYKFMLELSPGFK